MTNIEKLQRIRARCVELLAIAEKRTPGEWHVDQAVTWDRSRGIDPQIVQRNAYLTDDDAAFIASCAGAAEAGWWATIAAIDGLIKLTEPISGDCATDEMCRAYEQDSELASESINTILSAWPDELL